MKNLFLLLFSIISLGLYAQPPGQNAANWQAVPELTDEFNGQLNTGKWKFGHPWWRGRAPMSFGDGRNSFTQNGSLFFLVTEEPNPTANYKIRGGGIYSAQKSMKQGMYIESRYKASGMQIGTGFWLMHNDWRQDPQGLNRTDEIDIQEAFGGDTRYNDIMHMNTHWFKPGNNASERDDKPQPGFHRLPAGQTVSNGFHTYGLWFVNNSLIRWYFDGKMVRELRTNFTLQDMYASLNSETYGHLKPFPTVQDIRNNRRKILPGTSHRGEFQYIRCWKPGSGGGGNNGGGNNGSGTTVDVPGTLEAENSKPLTGGLRVVNAPGGKKALGYIKNNTYSEHFIRVPSGGGTYAIDLYAASAGSGGTIDFMIGSNKLATLNAPKTNGWDDYKKVSTTNNVRINGGVKTIRLVYKGSGNFLFNVDGLVFRNASGGGGGNNNAPLTCANAPTYNSSQSYSPGERVINPNDRRLYERTATGWDYIAQCSRSSDLSGNKGNSFDVAVVNNNNSTELNIESISGGDIRVDIYNLSGQSVYSDSFNTIAPMVTIRLGSKTIASGLYIAKVSMNGETSTVKFTNK